MRAEFVTTTDVPATVMDASRAQPLGPVDGHSLMPLAVGGGVFGYDYTLPADAPPGSWEIEAKVENAAHAKADDEIEIVVDAGMSICGDADGDGEAEFIPVTDPRTFGQHRLFRFGIGYYF